MGILLFVTVLLIAACGLIYELIAGTIASYLIGDSVFQFSTVIGTYLFAMGLGSATNRRYNLTFSINARNVFNNINFAPLVGNLSSPLFGEPNAIAGGPYGSASAPRKLELGAVFTF